MKSITRLRKVGGSLVATVPKALIDAEGLSEGQAVSIDIERVKKSYFGIAKGIGTLTKDDKKWMEGRHARD